MANGILDTSIPTINVDKIEKTGGSTPGKVKLTGMTITTLRYNIQNGYIATATEKFNGSYVEARRDVVADEVKAAENELLEIAGLEGYSEKELKLIKENNMVTLLSSPEIVEPKLKALGVSLINADSLFPRRKDKNIVAITESKYSPKALMVYSYLCKLCKRINIFSGVQLSDNHISIDTPENSEAEMSTWRSVFSNVVASDTDKVKENISVELFPNEEQKETNIQEEMSKRNMIAQIGTELDDVNRLLSGIASTTPFNRGLLERKEMLVNMLSNLISVNANSKSVNDSQEKVEVTEFQQLIDEVSGYVAPPTSEEHEKMNAEFQLHYNDPDVIQNMEDLRLKNILFDLNQPDAHAKVVAAERLDDAEKAKKISVANSVESDSFTNKPVDSIVRVENTGRNIVDTNEERYIAFQANAQAQNLYDENIKIGASIQAQKLFCEGLKVAAQEQAETIVKESYKEAAKGQAQELFKEDLKTAAEEQAEAITKASYKEAAKGQAQELFREDLKTAAQEQAEAITKASYKEAAKGQAQELFREDLKTAAQEQATELINSNVEKTISNEQRIYEEAGYIQARALFNEDLKNAAYEQAVALAHQDAVDYFKKAGESQAQLLFLETMKDYALEQAKMLNQQSNSNELQEQGVGYQMVDVNDRYATISSLSKPLKVKPHQANEFRKHYNSAFIKESVESNRDILVSLRAQLEDLGLGSDEEELRNGRTLAA